MAMPQPIFNKEKKKQIRGELESLLAGYSGDNESPVDDLIDDQLGEIAMAPPLNFDEMNRKFEKQAKDITGSMLKLYVDLGVIDGTEYVKQKQILDNTNITNIFFQLKTLRMAIEKIAEQINQGNTHPRLFEVFGQLQDKLTTVIKTQANYILFLEDTYKKMNQDLTQQTQMGPVKKLGSGRGEHFISAGTKNVMREITAEEVTEEKPKARRLTDPTRKAEIIDDFGVSETLKAEEIVDLSNAVNSLV